MMMEKSYRNGDLISFGFLIPIFLTQNTIFLMLFFALLLNLTCSIVDFCLQQIGNITRH